MIGTRRAGRYAFRAAWGSRRSFAVTNAWPLIFIFILIGGVFVYVGWFHRTPIDDYVRGGVIVAFAWIVWYLFDILGGAHWQDQGGWAERQTSKVLRKKLGRDWLVVDAIPFADGDVDHVAVGPGGLFAVETKWRGAPCDVTHTSVTSRGADLLAEARWAADKARKFVYSTLRQWHDVQPVLVLWGPGVAAVPDRPATINGVLVLTHPGGKGWTSHFQNGSFDGDLAEVRRSIETYIKNHRPRKRRRTRPS